MLTGNERHPAGAPGGQVRQEGSSWEGREVAQTSLKPLLYADASALLGFLLCPRWPGALLGTLCPRHPARTCRRCSVMAAKWVVLADPRHVGLCSSRGASTFHVESWEFRGQNVSSEARPPRCPAGPSEGLSPGGAEAWPPASAS